MASPFFQVLRTVPIWKFMKWVEGSVRFIRFCRVACREVLYGTSSMAKKNIRESPRCQFMAFEHSVFHSVPLLWVFFIGHQLLEDTLSDRRRKVQHVHTTSKFVARPFFACQIGMWVQITKQITSYGCPYKEIMVHLSTITLPSPLHSFVFHCIACR